MSITKAIADYSIAVGYNSSTRGKYGISLGTQSEQLDDGSISIGHNSDAGLTLGSSTWTEQTSNINGGYLTIVCDTPTIGAYSGSPLWIAISNSSSFMTSVDGETWTVHNSAGDGMDWRGSTSAVPTVGDLSNNMLFVAVGRSGSFQRLMTSQDGVNWTLRTTPNNNWESITHGVPSVGDLSNNMLFVAVAHTGTNDRIITSQDCITWTTLDTTNIEYGWHGITSGIPSTGNHTGKTLFVVISYDYYVITSEDSINWTLQTDPTGNSLKTLSICTGTPNTGIYANQTLFVSIGDANSSGVVMVSNDGYTWNQHTTPGDSNNWLHVSSHTKNGITIFIATANTGSSNRIMTSYDGYTWNTETTGNYDYRCIASGIPSSGTYSGETLIVVAGHTGSGTSRITTSNLSCKNSIAIGTNATTGAENCVAIGNGASTGKYHNAVAIGNGAIANEDDSCSIAGNVICGKITSGTATVNGTFNVDGGNFNLDGELYSESGHWIRKYGDQGIYWQDHGGGWHMNDTTYMRVYGNKSIHTGGGAIKTDNGTIKNVGYIGRGVDNPAVPLDIRGGVTKAISGHHYSDSGNYQNGVHIYASTHDAYGIGWIPWSNSENHSTAMYAPDGIVASRGFFAARTINYASDERIKTNIKEIDDTEALEKLRLLKPCKYNYIDYLERGVFPIYGFIAQEVKEVLPYAVQSNNFIFENKIPNIYKVCNITNGTTLSFVEYDISKNIVINGIEYCIPEVDCTTSKFQHDASNNISIILKNRNGEEITRNVINIVDEKTFEIDVKIEDNELADDKTIFVYGQEINDFHILNKTVIWTITTAALQEVDRQLQAEKAKTATLENEVTTLKTQMADLLARITALENP